MKLIQLNRGAFATVDDEDYALLSRFKWRIHVSSGKRYVACSVGCSRGQINITMHQLVLGGLQRRIDHIDGDGFNNQKSNLRPATQTQNMWNRKVQKHSSKFKGVSKTKHGTWCAGIRVNKIRIHLGHFKVESDAARAYDQAALSHFGDFARTNKMEGLLN